ncbi:homeobox-leucine zipper protein HAT22-like [Senna tora]|uniref:Homeobox-leucine zipper protein HAT22-like n=1 Tax=Senna tora TaxID=362788 RepID=A0A834X414_9FABA|nr:homeobox-leucine zipper protein HAT22-like [Senna tora]
MEDNCNTGLCLGLGMEGYTPKNKKHHQVGLLNLSFELCPKLNRDDDDHNSSNDNCRKKLRLTKDQSALLEHSFKLHTTLNPAQKQALAEQLNLKPRQVEVWFQNRRARTKLKQTEVECELLKKWCENLTDENRRLKKELQELRSSSPLYIQLSKPPTMCSSCHKLLFKHQS